MLIRLFQCCDRAVRAGLKAVMVLHQGWWLGILNSSQLEAVTQAYYDRTFQYSNSSYNLTGLRDWEQEALAKYFKPQSRILVAASGGGREVIALAQADYRVDGFDCNVNCVRAGQRLLAEQGLTSRIVHAPPSSVPEGLDSYDGAIVGWGGYMHIAGRQRRIRFLRRISQHLSPGAPVLVSFFHQHPKSRSHLWAARIANVLRRIKGTELAEAGDWLEGSFDHYFNETEIRAELSEAGFEVLSYSTPGYGVAVARAIG